MSGYGRRSNKPKVKECNSLDANKLHGDGCLKGAVTAPPHGRAEVWWYHPLACVHQPIVCISLTVLTVMAPRLPSRCASSVYRADLAAGGTISDVIATDAS
jgi:hypothetical protein